MFSIVLMSIYFLVSKRYLFAFCLLLLSVGIKFATGLLLPLFIIIVLFERKKVPVKWGQIFPIFTLTMVIGLVAATMRTNFQPWYLLYLLPFAAGSFIYIAGSDLIPEVSAKSPREKSYHAIFLVFFGFLAVAALAHYLG